jgi:glutamine phosphoribosylpyrophosphate amidotransferase
VCGISGIIHRDAGKGHLAPVGLELVNMLEAMKHRGEDSCGVTVSGEEAAGDLIVRLWASNGEASEQVLSGAEARIAECGGVVVSRERVDDYLRLVITLDGDPAALAKAVVNLEGVEIHSIGRASEVVKDVGTPAEMDHKHHVSQLKGTHGIGHLRMATESRVDVSHSHPFWAYPSPDITVVHNGQLTNYHKLTRHFQDQGYHFQTHNDSEVIAVYLADRLAQGAGLGEALRDSIEDLDGTFTYLVSTADGMGYAKDRWSAKPLVAMETENVVAVASEEVGLSAVFPGELNRFEPQESVAVTWSL